MPQTLTPPTPISRPLPRALSGQARRRPDVDDAVAAIIADVRARGDAALIELTARFDRLR